MASTEIGQSSHGLMRAPIRPAESDIRSRADADRVSNFSNGTILRSNVETRASAKPPRSPEGLPRGLGGMLKTGTETGEIGMFSIKPSRIRPHASNSPPRRLNDSMSTYMSQGPRPYHPNGVDDRRRLPSYSRDTSSEVISMYETASQKSPRRRHDHPEYRSYSMTQAYPQHVLSNHRSYSSLRSQPEGSVQRPISPFAYPARLKRPGFRPSSPALTDGGGVDYARRAEIERIYGPRSSSPSSLYAQKRRPPPLRQNVNRSNPSLLSQTSPRRSASPYRQQENGTPYKDHYRRNGLPTSLNSSPARSTLSLASTTNFYQAAAPQSTTLSTTTTPGKIPPPSPLYYDYTEDFEVEENVLLEPLDPPPQFRIEKTIPEDRPMSSHWQSVGNSGCISTRKPVIVDHHSSSPPLNAGLAVLHTPLKSNLGGNYDSVAVIHQANLPALTVAEDTLENDLTEIADEKKVIRLSRLGFGAQLLNSHVEEAFGLPSSPSFELSVPDNVIKTAPNNLGTGVCNPTSGTSAEIVDGTATQSMRTSTNSISTQAQKFPPPSLEETSLKFSKNSLSNEQPIDRECETQSHCSSERPLLQLSSSSRLKKTTGHDGTADEGSQSVPLRIGKKRTSIVAEMDTPDLTDLIASLEESSRQRKISDNWLSRDTPPHINPTTLQDAELRLASSLLPQNRITPLLSPLNTSKGHKTFDNTPEQLKKLAHRPSKKRRVDVATVPLYGEKHVPNFSHQIPQRIMSRSDSPILAPKPISPARQLRLKNSIPQLMKALPAVPLDIVTARVPPILGSSSFGPKSPCKIPPPTSEAWLLMIPATEQTTESIRRSAAVSIEALAVAELDSLAIKPVGDPPRKQESSLASPQHHKLKLKARNSGELPPSPLASRPWNQDTSYPWSSQVNVGLRPITLEPTHTSTPELPKLPKFKLKITRASNSTLGTVRVNRESADSKAGLQFHDSKDLFTPNLEYDNVFQMVSKHLHLRRASGKIQSVGSRKDQKLVQPASYGRNNQAQIELPQPSTESASPTDVRSFFSDNSSHANDRGSLREKLSNLKARMTLPYMSKIGARSHDDITWRGRGNGQIPKAIRSQPDLQFTRASVDDQPRSHGIHRITERIRNHHLRAKVSGWFKEARSAIRSRVKLRSLHAQRFEESTKASLVV